MKTPEELRGKVFFSKEKADAFKETLKPEKFLSIQSIWFDVPYRKNQCFAIVIIYLETKKKETPTP